MPRISPRIAHNAFLETLMFFYDRGILKGLKTIFKI